VTPAVRLLRPRRLLAVAAALALGVGAAGCSNDSVGSSGDTGYVAGKGTITLLPVAERETPGEVSGESLEGEPLSLADFKGSTVVVNVWGSWCAPCRAEAPELVAAAEELADDNVEFLGINSRDLDKSAARAFQRRYEVPYPSIYDQQGRTLLAFKGTLSPNAIPSTVILDKQGRVAASVVGEVSKSTLVGLVEDVQAASRTAAEGET
jgi:thiol-disulfide isomerase/thioredoxin